VVEIVQLGEVTCPSGELVLMDGGYLELWSGTGAPEDVAANADRPAVDFEIVGPDAVSAARSFDRQSGLMLYDIPQHAVEDFVATFDEHCRTSGWSALLRPFARQVPHRERVRRAVAAGDPDFLIMGVPVVSVGGLPTDRPLQVTAHRDDWSWSHFRILVADAPVAATRTLGSIGVDYARLVFADASALNAWLHEDAIDGLADVVFWGRDEGEVAAEFRATRTGTPGDDNYGWLNLPLREACAQAIALDERRHAEPERRFAVDFRPHSHHWQVMAGVRASVNEAATIEVGDATLMFAMTSVGDGFFPVQLDLDATGAVTAIQVTISDD
jgi:hypothetical protein